MCSIASVRGALPQLVELEYVRLGGYLSWEGLVLRRVLLQFERECRSDGSCHTDKAYNMLMPIYR